MVPVAAHQVVTQLWLLSSLVVDSVAIAGQSLVAVQVRNHGWQPSAGALWGAALQGFRGAGCRLAAPRAAPAAAGTACPSWCRFAVSSELCSRSPHACCCVAQRPPRLSPCSWAAATWPRRARSATGCWALAWVRARRWRPCSGWRSLLSLASSAATRVRACMCGAVGVGQRRRAGAAPWRAAVSSMSACAHVVWQP